MRSSLSALERSPANPFFSPDGKWIGYFSAADSKLKKIAITGGAPMTLCDVSAFTGGSWGADDTIVYGEYSKGIKRVSANGGTPEVIVKEAGYHPNYCRTESPCCSQPGPPPYKIVVQSLQSGERKELFAGDNARYISTGHIVYAVGNNLFAVPFDLKTLKVTGEPMSRGRRVYGGPQTYIHPSMRFPIQGRWVIYLPQLLVQSLSGLSYG